MEVLDRRLDTAMLLMREEKGEKELARLLADDTKRMLDRRSHHHKKWADYGRLVRGDHHVLPPIGINSQLTLNLPGKTARVITAMITQGRVRFEVTSKKPESEENARVADARCQDIQDSNHVELTDKQILQDAVTYGNGYSYVWYDEDANEGTGEHRIDWLDCYNVAVDEYATQLRNAQVVMMRQLMPVGVAEAMWPEFKGRFKVERRATDTDLSGLYRPEEDVPNTRPWQLTSRFSGSNGTGSETFSDLGRLSEEGAEATPTQETEIIQYFVKATYADAMYDPRVLKARGLDQEAQARDENARLGAGEWIDVEPDQDHGAHFAEHRKEFMARAQDGDLPDELGALLAEHLARHRQHMQDPMYRKMRASRFPGGRRLIIRAGDVILYDGPMKTGALPISHMKCMEDSGSFYGLSKIVDSESICHGVNLLYSTLLDQARFAAYRPCIIDEASGIKDESLVAQPGSVIRANRQPNVPPVEWAQAPPLDRSNLDYANSLVTSLEEQTGLSKAIEGQLPGSGLSGNALRTLVEGGKLIVTQIADNFRMLKIQQGEAVVAQMVAFDREPMMLRVQANPNRPIEGSVPAQDGSGSVYVGINQPDGTNQIQTFVASDFGISVNASGTVAMGKIEQRDEALTLGQQGLLHPELVRRKLAAIGTLSPSDLIMQRELEQRDLAMQMGQMPPGARAGAGPEAAPPPEAMPMPPEEMPPGMEGMPAMPPDQSMPM